MEIGGFSFPVTPTSGNSVQKICKSWPSVKSNTSASEPLEDVSGTPAADYMDEGVDCMDLPYKNPSKVWGTVEL